MDIHITKKDTKANENTNRRAEKGNSKAIQAKDNEQEHSSDFRAKQAFCCQLHLQVLPGRPKGTQIQL